MRVRVVVAGAVDGVKDAISSFMETVTKRMIMSVFVVISHITLVLLGGANRGTSSLFYSNLAGRVTVVDNVKIATMRREGVVLGIESLLGVTGSLLVVGGGIKAGVTLFDSEGSGDGTGTLTVLVFRDVDLGGDNRLGDRAVDGS